VRTLGLKPGSRLLLSTEKDGSLRLRPYRSLTRERDSQFEEGRPGLHEPQSIASPDAHSPGI
jgi:hypothetical protein